MAKDDRPDFLAALEAATDADLAAVRKEADGLEQRLRRLRSVQKLLAAALHGPADKKVVRPKDRPIGTVSKKEPVPGGMDGRRRLVVKELLTFSRATKDALCASTGISKFGPGALSQVLEHPWFHVAPDGVVSLTSAGEKDNKGLLNDDD